MALIARQTQGPYQTASLRQNSSTKGKKVGSFVAFTLVRRTNAFSPFKRCLYLRSQPIESSKAKPFHVLSFKGNAQNDEGNRSGSSSKSIKTPVQFSHSQGEREEVVTDSPDVQNHLVSYASEDREDGTEGSIAIQKLFRKWLLMLRTQTSSPATEVLCQEASETITSEGRKVKLGGEAGRLLKSAVTYFMKFDAAISLPLLIFIPFYLSVRVAYGAEVAKELTPMWVFGPLIVALYVKLIKGLCSLYASCFMMAIKLVKNSPSYFASVFNYIAEGKLKTFLWARFLKPIEDIKNTDYKQFTARKIKQLQEWAAEKYLDFVESIWPYYCRTIRFLKKANLI